MADLLSPDLQARMHTLARILADAQFGVHKIDVVVSDRPLPVCEWCADDRPEHEAPIEILHDCGSVHACWDCVITAATAAASESQDGWFRVEITQRSGA